MEILIIEILWMLIVMSFIMQYEEVIVEISTFDKMIAFFIFLIGAPFMLFSNICLYILNNIFSEGWNDDDMFKGY